MWETYPTSCITLDSRLDSCSWPQVPPKPSASTAKRVKANGFKLCSPDGARSAWTQWDTLPSTGHASGSLHSDYSPSKFLSLYLPLALESLLATSTRTLRRITLRLVCRSNSLAARVMSGRDLKLCKSNIIKLPPLEVWALPGQKHSIRRWLSPAQLKKKKQCETWAHVPNAQFDKARAQHIIIV